MWQLEAAALHYSRQILGYPTLARCWGLRHNVCQFKVLKNIEEHGWLAADLCYVNSSKSGIQGLEFFDPRFSGSSGDEESLSLDSLYRKCLYICISSHSLCKRQRSSYVLVTFQVSWYLLLFTRYCRKFRSCSMSKPRRKPWTLDMFDMREICTAMTWGVGVARDLRGAGKQLTAWYDVFLNLLYNLRLGSFESLCTW